MQNKPNFSVSCCGGHFEELFSAISSNRVARARDPLREELWDSRKKL